MGHNSGSVDHSGKVALISGITGQDGSYLCELLLSLGYSAVHGIIRRSSITARPRIDHLQSESRLHLHYGDILDSASLNRIFRETQPHEVYHLAAMSQVHVSFGIEEYTADADYIGTVRMLEAFREHCRTCPQANAKSQPKFYNAASSEMFGNSPPPQNEQTRFAPVSPYGIAKLASFHHACMYREAYGLHVSNGILFNHESPRRGESFVSRKITRGVARAAMGLQDSLVLGNMAARRDWMHAKDAVRGMHAMLQQEKPGDYVLASGRSESIREFIQLAINSPILPTATISVKSDDSYRRPLEVDYLCGDATKARIVLGWRPEISLEQLVNEMVAADLAAERAKI